MKRLVTSVVVIAAATLGFAVGPASGQTGDTTATTVESTTTTEVPTTTTTVDTGSTTTLAPPATTTTLPQINLPGEHVTAGQLKLGATFQKAESSSCTASGSVAGGEINVMKDEAGKIGVVYGKANLGTADAGLVMVGLGPLPLAIGAYRTTGSCNQDVVAIGAYDATATTASLSSVGYGFYPKDFANSVQISLDVAGTAPTATLNLQGAYDFLAAPRPAN